jgi:predicted hotdog family 3-hydroxylacyl-ACP dehydratase
MNLSDLRPESILPHRGSMLLIDSILELDEKGACTRAVVAPGWPFCDGRGVQAIVLIELVAQTAGIHNGWIRDRRHGPAADKKGWIVGIRQAHLPVDAIPLGTELITRTENRMEFEGFRDIYGTVALGAGIAAEITLQLLRSEPAPAA